MGERLRSPALMSAPLASGGGGWTVDVERRGMILAVGVVEDDDAGEGPLLDVTTAIATDKREHLDVGISRDRKQIRGSHR
jgi:hypothetical protein